MLMERIAIARGHQRAQLSLVPPPVESPTDLPCRRANERMSVLERLAALHERGILSDEEFAAEKALILGMPVRDEIAQEAASAAPGPSLAGRLLRWQLLPLGLLVGLGFSYATQPRDTLRFLDQILRLLGA